VDQLLEFRTQPGTGIPQYKVKWTGWGNNQTTWEKADQIDESAKREFWLNSSKKATYRKRPVGAKAMDKRKTRKETIEMINAERNKVLNLPVTTSATYITPCHHNTVNMEDGYNHITNHLFMWGKRLAPINQDIENELNEDLRVLEEEYDKNFPPLN